MKKESTTKQKMTRIVKTPKKTKSDKDNPFVWEAKEIGLHKRWRWFIGFSLILIWLVCILILLRAWVELAVTLVAAVAIFVTYARKPYTLTYCLDTTRLVVRKNTFLLKNYRAFTLIEELPTKKDIALSTTVMLLPKQRFGLPVVFALPESDKEAEEMFGILTRVLSFDDAKDYRLGLRVLDHMAKWLRLE